MEKYKKEELERYIFEENMPYDKIGEKYGVTGSSIRKQAKRMGINLPKRRKINPSESFNKGEHLKEVKKCFQCGREITYKYGDRKYCSLECWAEATREKKVKEWKEHPEKFKKENLPDFIREYLMEKYDNKCEICGWGETNPTTGKIPLQVHHINGDCTDNREENLQLLCPNHHSLTETFGSLNNGNSKRYKLKEYKQKMKINI